MEERKEPAPHRPLSPEERERLWQEGLERGRKEQEELDRQGKSGISIVVPSPKPKP